MLDISPRFQVAGHVQGCDPEQRSHSEMGVVTGRVEAAVGDLQQSQQNPQRGRHGLLDGHDNYIVASRVCDADHVPPRLPLEELGPEITDRYSLCLAEQEIFILGRFALDCVLIRLDYFGRVRHIHPAHDSVSKIPRIENGHAQLEGRDTSLPLPLEHFRQSLYSVSVYTDESDIPHVGLAKAEPQVVSPYLSRISRLPISHDHPQPFRCDDPPPQLGFQWSAFV
ncbi:hypothetical protein HG530_005974 [Fusarium avenaceum]|nr:hypothetical protein HG530_005974 [Fusarium avenaceum]